MNLKGILVSTDQIPEMQARILKKLLRDGRKSVVEIARELNLTNEVVKKNYCEMERKGIINGATIHINYGDFGYKAVAHLMIRVDSPQVDLLLESLKDMPEVYSIYKSGAAGNVDAILTLRNFQQLDDVKHKIKSQFSVSEMKTAIWTDVREMHGNLGIFPHETVGNKDLVDCAKTKRNGISKIAIDRIDQKIADELAKDGQVSISALAKKAGISPNNVRRRYEELKKNGMLKVTIQIDPVKIGYQALVVFFAVTSNEDLSSIIAKISLIPDVISIMKTSGDYDLQVYAMIRDLRQLLSTQEELEKTRGILKMDMELRKIPNKWPTPRQYISTF